MPNVDRNALLGRFPDIAALLDKVEQSSPSGPNRPTPGNSAPKRPKGTLPTKRVKGRAGYKGYTMVNWEGLAQTPRKWSDVDTSRVVVSSGHRRS